MGALPKKKISKSRARKRFSTKGYTAPKLILCEKCSNPRLPHRVCPTCGYYGGSQIIKPKEEVKVTKVTEVSGSK